MRVELLTLPPGERYHHAGEPLEETVMPPVLRRSRSPPISLGEPIDNVTCGEPVRQLKTASRGVWDRCASLSGVEHLRPCNPSRNRLGGRRKTVGVVGKGEGVLAELKGSIEGGEARDVLRPRRLAFTYVGVVN